MTCLLVFFFYSRFFSSFYIAGGRSPLTFLWYNLCADTLQGAKAPARLATCESNEELTSAIMFSDGDEVLRVVRVGVVAVGGERLNAFALFFGALPSLK